MGAVQRWLQSWKFRIQNWIDLQRMQWIPPSPEEQRHLDNLLRQLPRQPVESLEDKHRKIAAGEPILLTDRQFEALVPFVDNPVVASTCRIFVNAVNEWMDQRKPLQGKGARIAYQRLVEYRLMHAKPNSTSRNPAENVQLAVSQDYLCQTLVFNHQRLLHLYQQIQEHNQEFHPE